MTPEQLETVAKLAESFDKRISDIDARFVAVEAHLADGARAADEQSKELTNLGESYKVLADNYRKLAEEIVKQGQRHDDAMTLVQNYIEATVGLRQDARNLISEVRRSQAASE